MAKSSVRTIGFRGSPVRFGLTMAIYERVKDSSYGGAIHQAGYPVA